MKLISAWFFASLLLCASAEGQESDLLRPAWKTSQPEVTSAPQYTGKYCDFDAFEGLEFTFSGNSDFEQHGFLNFRINTNGIGDCHSPTLRGRRERLAG